jgi:hypothetical protein
MKSPVLIGVFEQTDTCGMSLAQTQSPFNQDLQDVLRRGGQSLRQFTKGAIFRFIIRGARRASIKLGGPHCGNKFNRTGGYHYSASFLNPTL